MNIGPNDPTLFGEDYFLRGEELGLSGYSSYSWKPDATLPMACYIQRYLGIKGGDRGNSVLDWGCSRGYLVKALRMLNIESYGYDVSEWAITNCDPSVKDYVSTTVDLRPMSYDFVIAKDVMEHLTKGQLSEVLPKLLSAATKAVLIIVPLTGEDGGPYLCPRDEKDPTHKIRWNLTTWLSFLQNLDRRCVCSGSFYVPGIKQENCNWENSCGFFLIKRV